MAVKIIVILVAATLLVWIVVTIRNYARGGSYSPAGLDGVPKNELRTLKNICRGDADRMYRLVEYEKNRNPGISNKEAVRRAISSYSRDNR
jgi:hypothetical protein